jgi:hypothetical protein
MRSIPMSEKYPFIPDYLTKPLEDVTIPLIDVLHGYLKVEMLDMEGLLDGDNDDRFLEGYMQALTNIYTMTYNLSIDRKLIEERPNA